MHFVMKTVGLVLTSLMCVVSLHAQTWTWASELKAGTNVEAFISGISEEEGPWHLVYYSFDGTKLTATDVGMVPGDQAGQYKAPVPLSQKGSWLCLALKNRENDIQSKTIATVNNDKAQPGTLAVEKALAMTTFARALDIERNDMEANSLFFEAVHASPKWMDEPDVLRAYYQVAKATNTKPDLDYIKNYITPAGDQFKIVSEAQLVNTVRIAKDMGDTTLQLKWRKTLDTAFPKNIMLQEEQLLAFKNAATIEDKINMREAFKSTYTVADNNRGYFDQMTSTLAQHYASVEDWDKVKSYADQMLDPMARANVCNSYAWTLSGESIEKEGSHYDIAEYLSSTSLKMLSPEITNKPPSMTKNEWSENLEFYKAQFGDTYALIRFKQGHVDDALDHQLFAVQKNEYQDGEMNERYAVYLEKAGQKKMLAAYLEKTIAMGKATANMKAMHKAYWTQEATTDELYQQYFHQLESKALAALQDKVAKGWKNDESVGFALKDLAGNEVSLSSYKGKTVVLDFWATWCGPCKASFPGMKMAVEHYASDPNVVFLFIDTWENDEKVNERVSGFIKDNNYPFHVLMDMDDKVVTSYKVSGIPTKFVIGPDQKVRFVSVGFSGNNDELLEEMKVMVEMARNGGVVIKT